MRTEYIATFDSLTKDDVALAGGKGANLGELTKAGFPVPEGFVILVKAYQEFIESSGLSLQIKNLRNPDVEDTTTLQQISESLQSQFLKHELSVKIKKEILDSFHSLYVPREALKKLSQHARKYLTLNMGASFVAVRSSATAEDSPAASFAGQNATFLNVKGDKELIEAVKKCWASLFTARSIYYRVKNNFPHEKTYLAVVVQKMINSEKSGVIFSINPATNNPDEIVIEAGFGLGEAIVSGAINPDHYTIDKRSLKIKDILVKEKLMMYTRDSQGKNTKIKLSSKKANEQVLSIPEIKKLSDYAKKSELHYGAPQDMEWAIEEGRVYIVQSRPVTTYKNKNIGFEQPAFSTQQTFSPTQASILVKGLPASPGIASGPVRKILTIKELYKVRQGDILVTTMTTPDMVPAMQKSAAIVTDEGGSTSHAAIVGREMGVPVIVGTANATRILHDEQIITVDATNGLVYEGELNLQPQQEQLEQSIYQTNQPSPQVTATKIKLVLDFPDYAEKYSHLDVDGIGLLRAEHMILGTGIHPAYFIAKAKSEQLVQIIFDGISKTCKAFYPRPVWYRTLDEKTAEFRNLKGGENEPVEENPALGWRGIRRGLDQKELLMCEFEAIRRVKESGLNNIGVMLPLVSHLEQIRQAKNIMQQIGLTPIRDIPFGVMIETPASVLIIEDICREGVSFLSFGTNDLTQYTLAIDRDNRLVQKYYDELHPSVLKSIARVIKVAKKYNIETSICGQAGSNPQMAAFLVQNQIDSISVAPDAVNLIKSTVARIEQQIILQASYRFVKEQNQGLRRPQSIFSPQQIQPQPPWLNEAQISNIDEEGFVDFRRASNIGQTTLNKDYATRNEILDVLRKSGAIKDEFSKPKLFNQDNEDNYFPPKKSKRLP